MDKLIVYEFIISYRHLEDKYRPKVVNRIIKIKLAK